MTPATPLLELSKVTRRYPNGTLALDGVNLTVGEREFVSLVGPSGCGKSTLLRIVAGIAPGTSGSVVWNGPAPAIGFVFQDAALMPWATVERNVRLPLELAGVDEPAIRKRTGQTLDLVGLEKFAAAYPRELSGGMRMRVSIARALAAEPRMLLMDEPFAALDEPARERLNGELRAIWASAGLTVIFVTHSVYESVFLSSRVVVLSPRPGRVAASLPTEGPEPRDHDYRLSPLYAERCRMVRAAMQEAAAA